MCVCVAHFIVRCPASCFKAREKPKSTVQSKVACLDRPSVKSCKSVNSILVTLSVYVSCFLKSDISSRGSKYRKLQSIAFGSLMGTFCLLPNGDTVAQH